MKQKSIVTGGRRTSSGFTLVELLVVITIIIVLAGIGYPTIGKMRASAARSECLSQMRSWGIAIGGYAADHDGRVEWKSWYPIEWARDDSGKEKASPYVHYWTGGTVDVDNRADAGAFDMQIKMRSCPVVRTNTPRGVRPAVSYSMIRPNPPESNVTTYSLARVNNPSRFIMMIETITNTLSPLSSAGDFTAKVKPLTVKGADLRHSGIVNSLMGDYSVRSMTWKEVEKGASYWANY